MDKSKIMMFIIIGLLVVLLGTVVGVTFYLINLVGDDNQEAFNYVAEPPPPPNLNLMNLIEVSLGERITTNLAIGERGTSDSVVAEVVLGINNTGDESEVAEFIEDINNRIRFARGVVIDVFSGLTYEQVRTTEGRNAVQEEVKLSLQDAFGTNLIIVVHFSEWIVMRGR